MTLQNNNRFRQISPIVWILLGAILIRIIHLASTVSNPMTYFPGPDEQFYLDFGSDVAAGSFGLSEEFIFMDPLYGYFLGFCIALFGNSLFIIYLIQALVNVFTVWVVYKIGVSLWDRNAGLIAAGLYACTSIAVFYTTTILKPSLVAAFLSLWVLLTFRVAASSKIIAWFSYGVFLGLGLALRSNLLLLFFASTALFLVYRRLNLITQDFLIKGTALVLGFVLVLGLLLARNVFVSKHWSVMPPNSGVVLHQLYNAGNPESVEYSPEFVSYRNPAENLYGYRSEAARRLGREVSISEMSSFWREQAKDYAYSNLDIVFVNYLRKAREFVAYRELANNRNFYDEIQFSSVMSILPQPFGILVALGSAGMLLLVLNRFSMALPLLCGLGLVFITFIMFIAASRFRAHGLPLFAVGSGVFIAALLNWKALGQKQVIASVLLAIVVGVSSFVWGRNIELIPGSQMPFAWGYLRMGLPEMAFEYSERQMKMSPQDPAPYELLGYSAINDKQYEQAQIYLTKATELAPERHVNHYNLSLVYKARNQFVKALGSIENAIELVELPQYLFEKGLILEQMGRLEESIQSYLRLVESGSDSAMWKPYMEQAKTRLNELTEPR